jgi:predicted AlkP superfamily phosphohydrolase/phosphomutase
MKKPVIAIGLDAADPSLIEQWMDRGHLENISRLREQGTYARLENLDYYRAETPWTTFLTGCSPQKTGYWSPIKFYPETYDAKLVEAYDFKEYRPFYALGDDFRVAVFDMPHAQVVDGVNGIQVMAWGAHSPQGPSASQPASLLQEIIDKHGSHPGLHNDHANCFDRAALERLQGILETGIARRAEICKDLLQQEQWDLFLTIFGETHAAGHFMWHLSQPDHPLYETLGEKGANDRMLAVFKAIDRAIGEILTAAPEDAHIIVFSAHGMGTNVMDVPSGTFLPEFLYRYSFPGRYGIAKGEAGTPVADPITQCKKNSWAWEVWSSKDDPNPLRRFLRREAPYRVFKRIEPFLGSSPQPDLVSPQKLNEQSNPMSFQPAEWYKPCWSKMKAFALPSFSEGYVRINLQGREAQGIVAPEDYEAVCDEISQKLYALKDARTGTPMVKRIVRMRQSPSDRDPKLPDADLAVIWQEEYAADTVDSPEYGRIGPVPHFRTGSHRAEGFFIGKGPGIEAGSNLPVSRSFDLTPTILQLMDAPIPAHCEGKSLIETTVLAG